MKFKLKFMESKTPRIVNAKSSAELKKYMMEKMDKLESFEPMYESVRVTPELVEQAWKELIRRARGKFVSTVALSSVCMEKAQNSEWEDEKGTDTFAFDKLYDILVDRLDNSQYELVDEGEYNAKFNTEKGPQTSFDVKMNNIRKMNNARIQGKIRESAVPVVEKSKVTEIFNIVNWLCLNCTEKQEDKLTELSNLLEEVFNK